MNEAKKMSKKNLKYMNKLNTNDIEEMNSPESGERGMTERENKNR